MYKELNFPVLIVHRDVKADTVAGERIRGIAAELEQDGFNILPTASSAEGASSPLHTMAWRASSSRRRAPEKISGCCKTWSNSFAWPGAGHRNCRSSPWASR